MNRTTLLPGDAAVRMMLQQILALVFVLALLGSALFLLRQKGLARFTGFSRRGGARSGEIKLLDRLSVTPQHSLLLVEVANESILKSQLTDLEEPTDAIVVSIDKPPEVIVAEIIEQLKTGYPDAACK